MGDVTRYAQVRFELTATIGGTTFKDVVAFTSDFEANAIPKATITVAVGRGFRGNYSQAATIHEAIGEMKVQMPAKVKMKVIKIDSSPGDAEKWPSGEFTIFDGYAVGTGWRRGESGAQFSIYMLHWLSDLAYSSSVSRTSHPGNDANFGFNATHIDVSACAGLGANEPHWVSQTGASVLVTDANIEDDLWGKVLQPWMTCVASQDFINAHDLPGSVLNDTAKKALERMAPFKQVKGYVKSSLKLAGADPGLIRDAMKAAMLKETFESWVNTTLWDKLISEWCPSYFLGVVPRVEDAMVIPFTPGLQQEYKTIEGKEYNYTSLDSTMPIVPRAVGILSAALSPAGRDGGYPAAATIQQGLVGYYSPGGNPTGMVILKSGPRWLGISTTAQVKSRATTGAEGKLVGTASSPGEGEAGDGNAAADIETSATALLDAFAHQWFMVEMLKGRHSELSGKLRFDIAPFSTVKIKAVGEKHIKDDPLAATFYGTVLRVSTQIDAEGQKASTAFSIAHNRTESENKDERTSIEMPPFFTTKFTGCSLIDGF